MTEGTSEQPGGPEQHPAETNPDKPTTPAQEPSDAVRDTASVPAPEPAKSKPRRSGEFWLALASIAATVVVGLTGFWVNYRTSTNQISAESQRAADKFNKEQRQSAYSQYLTSEADLVTKEYQLLELLTPSDGVVDLEQVALYWNAVEDSAAKDLQTYALVELVGSKAVIDAAEALSAQEDSVHSRIANLVKAARAKNLSPADDNDANDLLKNAFPAQGKLRTKFTDAAWKELGFT